MPLYEYRCEECETGFEVLQRLGEGADGLSCPACGSARLAKQLSTFSATTASGGSARATSAAASCGRGFT